MIELDTSQSTMTTVRELQLTMYKAIILKLVNANPKSRDR